MAKSREVQERDKWKAQDDMRTLEGAAEIMRDKARLNSAQTEAKRQMEALQQVAKRAPVKAEKAAAKRSAPKRKARAATKKTTRRR